MPPTPSGAATAGVRETPALVFGMELPDVIEAVFIEFGLGDDLIHAIVIDVQLVDECSLRVFVATSGLYFKIGKGQVIASAIRLGDGEQAMGGSLALDVEAADQGLTNTLAQLRGNNLTQA